MHAQKKRRQLIKRNVPQWDSDLQIFILQVALLPLNLFTLHSTNKQLSDLIIHIYFSIKILSDSIQTQQMWHLSKKYST